MSLFNKSILLTFSNPNRMTLKYTQKEILGKPNTIGGDMQYVFLHSQLACTHMSFPDWQFSFYAFHWRRIGEAHFTYVKSCQATFALASPDRICNVANLLFSWSWGVQTILISLTKWRNIANKLAELSAGVGNVVSNIVSAHCARNRNESGIST